MVAAPQVLIRKYSPTAGDVHVNTPLTNISIAYLQNANNFIASRVFPNIPVQKQSDRYYTYARGEFNRDEMKRRAPGTESAGATYTVDNTPTYFCDVWAIHKDVPDQIRANADSVLQLDREATEFVTHKALIKKEVTWATNYFATSVWTNEVDGVDASPSTGEVLRWNDANSTPIEDVRTAKTTVLKSTGFMPNTLVLGQQVYDKLVDHPDIVDRIKYGQTAGQPAMAGRQALAQLFEIENVYVMSAIYNTAGEGLTASHSFIGGDHALVCYAAPTPGIMVPSAGYTFSWTGYLNAGAEGNRIRRFRMEALESDRVELDMAFDLKLIAADLGYFFKSIITTTTSQTV